MEPRTVQIEKGEFLHNLQVLKEEYVPDNTGILGDHHINYDKITVNHNAITVQRGNRFSRWLRGVSPIQLDLEDGANGQTIIASDVNAGTILLLQLIPALFVFMPTAIFVLSQGHLESVLLLLTAGAIVGLMIWWSYRSNQRNLNQHIERIIDEVTLFSKVD
ncbi:MAG: hypothetical protein AAGA85_20600 [Bacteroidota bacterium]